MILSLSSGGSPCQTTEPSPMHLTVTFVGVSGGGGGRPGGAGVTIAGVSASVLGIGGAVGAVGAFVTISGVSASLLPIAGAFAPFGAGVTVDSPPCTGAVFFASAGTGRVCEQCFLRHHSCQFVRLQRGPVFHNEYSDTGAAVELGTSVCAGEAVELTSVGFTVHVGNVGLPAAADA